MRKNKLYSVLLSLAVAFGLWLYVVNNISQGDEATFFNIPVVMKGETVLTERNMMITGTSSETVSLRLSGARSELSKVNSGNINVEVDLSSIEAPGERIELRYTRISYPGDVPSNAFVVESKNPGAIYVDVDYRQTNEIPIQVSYTGERSENHIYDTENATLDAEKVTVSGPAAVVEKIAYAGVEVDLTNRVESFSESFRYTLCDADGEPVDAQLITTNLEEVRLDMQIQQIKVLTLKAELLYASGATEENTTVEIEPASIRVSGGEAVLDALGDTYSVGTINLADLDKAVNELTYPITLPEGVTNQTGVSEASVKVRFTGLKTRDITLETIGKINVPEGLQAEIISASLVVKVRGPADQIDALTEKDVTAVVDFSNAEVGNATYRVNLTFGPDFPDVGAIKKSAFIPATVTAAEE